VAALARPLTALALALAALMGCDDGTSVRRPPSGFVPDEATAVRIAEAVWLPIYGEAIAAKKPFKATLQGGVWFVNGTAASGQRGVPQAQILAADASILRVAHTQ